MKKVILAASLLALSMGAYAQEAVVATVPVVPVAGAKYYKPVQGDLLAEIGLFGGDVVNLSSSAFGTPQLKFRYFIQDQIAIRAGLNLSQHAETQKVYGANGEKGSQRSSNSIWGVNVGVEKHFAGTGRLSTYAGGDLSFQITSASGERKNTDGNGYVNGESEKIRGYNYANGATSGFGFGLRAVTGADYYFVEKVYLGAELGWGFMATVDGKTKTETTTGGVTLPTQETKSTGGTFDLMPSLTAGVRIGYRF